MSTPTIFISSITENEKISEFLDEIDFNTKDVEDVLKMVKDHSREFLVSILRSCFNSEELKSSLCWLMVTACQSGDIEKVKFLAEEVGYPIEIIRGMENLSLQSACERGHSNIVKYLFSPNVGLTIRDTRTDTAPNCMLLRAAENGHIEVVKFLIEKVGLDLDDIYGIRDYDRSVIKIAALRGHEDVTKYLHDQIKKMKEEERVLQHEMKGLF